MPQLRLRELLQFLGGDALTDRPVGLLGDDVVPILLDLFVMFLRAGSLTGC
jgi:hypothetical protein